jgi:integrase
MASIAKRDNGRWRARYRDVRGKEHARHFDRKIDAQHWLDNVTTSIQSGAYVDPARGRETVADYADTWMQRQVQLKPSTRSRYAAIVRLHVKPHFGDVPLARIERSDISSWVADLAAGRHAAPTVRHIYKVLHGILQSAMLDGRIARNPAIGIKLPHDTGKEKRFLTHEQVAALANAAGDERLAIEVLAYCGLRFGELAALRVRDVDFLHRRLRIEQSATEVDGIMVFGTPKSHQQRSVPIRRSLLEPLALACEGKSPDDLVFTAPRGGVIFLRNWRKRVFDPAVQAAGLAPLSPHELRHTAASLAVAAGANVKAVQRMLGHASAAMTLDTYSGLFEDDLDDVADRLDAAAGAAGRCGTVIARCMLEATD